MYHMFMQILAALWFFFPAGVSNAAPIFAARVPLLSSFNRPLDGGAYIHGERALGDHKTWRGLLVGMVASTVTFWLMQLIARDLSITQRIVALIPQYESLPTLALGPLLGLGALGGDAVESFFKRRRGTSPGESWFPFDQIDYIIGASLISLPFVVMSLSIYLWALLLWPTIHIVSTGVGYIVGLKDHPI